MLLEHILSDVLGTVLAKAVLLGAHPAGISVIFLPMLQENVGIVKTGAEGVWGGVVGRGVQTACQTMTSPSRRDKRGAAGQGLKEHPFHKPTPGTLIESLGTTRVSEHIISISAVLPRRSRNYSS